MGRNKFGEPYDPALRNTECGMNLYNVWRRVRRGLHIDEWDYYPNFYEWAMRNGYTLGATLRIIDTNKPYAPDNCTWYIPGDGNRHVPVSFADEWNKTVNRIRKHYGMPPLEGTEYVD